MALDSYEEAKTHMKFLLITPFYRPGVGGSARLLQDITDHINATGHRMDVLTYGDSRSSENREFDEKQTYKIFRIRPQSGAGMSSLIMFFTLLRLMMIGRYDRILSGVAFPSAVLAYAVSKLLGTPYFVYSYAEDVTCVKDSERKKTFLARALNHARQILVISKFTVNEIKALGVSDRNITLMPPGIEVSRYQGVSGQSIAAMRARFHLQDKRILLTLARLTTRKGHDNIIKALPRICAQYPDLHYLIIGYGDPEPLLTLASAEGIRDRVTIVDHVTDAELPIVFHMCDIFAMVSRWDPNSREVEGFGIVYLEAAACGKPCVAGSHGGCPDAVADKVTGFIVDPTSVKEIECALSALMSDPEASRTMGEEARKRVTNDFDREMLLERATAILLAS